METIVGLSKQYELETDAMRAQATAMKERLAMTPVSMRDQVPSRLRPRKDGEETLKICGRPCVVHTEKGNRSRS